ncbi:hypothetical protein BDR05DRAFT_878287, partial [Suillus weaverae]
IKLSVDFPKCLTSLYIALRTQHIPLCCYLHRIKKEPSPHCSHCPGTDETVPHYLLNCPRYRREHHILIQALGRKASSLSFLLSDLEATQHLTQYVNATGRLKSTFSEVLLPCKPPD